MGAPARVVEARRLGVELGGAPVLRGVDLSIAPGEVVAVLGSNGAGKSTLVKTLVGLVPAAAGRVALYGADPAGASGAVPWQRIGYAPQRTGATTGVPATALEVVASGLLHRGRLRPGRDARRRSLEALGKVGLAGRANESLHVLSGGQQQRVLIARALARQPDLLILDEPLSGMDRESMEALASTLAALRAHGVTVVVVLHDLGPLGPLITRSVVLHEGRVVHDGPTPPAEPSGDAAVDPHPHPAAPAPGPGAPDLQRQW